MFTYLLFLSFLIQRPKSAAVRYHAVLSDTESESGNVVSFQCCLTSTETIRLIRDGEPRTDTSTFTRLLNSRLLVLPLLMMM